jgi:hypothetical protein
MNSVPLAFNLNALLLWQEEGTNMNKDKNGGGDDDGGRYQS